MSAETHPRRPRTDRVRALPAATARLLAWAAVLTVAAVPGPAPVAAQEAWAFVGVNVLSMETDGVLQDRVVVVRDGRIERVAPAAGYQAPGGVTVLDGRGRWLMPGLAEMHAHVPPVAAGSTDWPDREALEDILFLYVANGITTIRGMLGADYQLELREELEAGRILGPTLHVGAPSLNGTSAPTPEAAERLLRTHAERGYHFQKIHPGLSRATWDRMAAVARELDFTFSGHVPEAVGVEHALATGMSTVDHLDGYVMAVASEPVRRRLAAGEAVPLGEIVASATDARIAEVARRTREAGTWNVPTLYLWENLYGRADPADMAALPEMRYVSPQQRQAWTNQARNRPSVTPGVERAHNDLRKRILKALADAGAGILMGTDSPQLWNVPGFALHREIVLMRGAGLTPLQILRSGTRDVARYVAGDLGGDGSFGTVAAGQRADLVLLEGNPLEDLDHLNRRAGVMVRGRWLGAEEVRAGLARLAVKHGG